MEKVTIAELEDLFYLSYNHENPGESEDDISATIGMKLDEYQKVLESEFCGIGYDFGIWYCDDDGEGGLTSTWSHNEDATAFRDRADAEAAKEWVESRLLAKKMSEPQMLMGIDWGYGPVKTSMTIIDYPSLIAPTPIDKKELDRIKDEMIALGRKLKCV